MAFPRDDDTGGPAEPQGGRGRAARRCVVSRAIAVALAGAAATAGCGGHHTGQPDRTTHGRRLFVGEGCGACHTVAAAHTHGRVGPDFDTSEPLTRAQIRRQLRVGEGGMPSFRGRLTRADEAALVEFVFRTMHRPG